MSERVQSTNDNSCVSKASMVHQGYFEDKFASLFVDKNTRRSPVINRGYYIRVHAINKALTSFLNYFNERSSKPQIVSLGSGYDSAYFRLKNDNIFKKGNIYFEIDFMDLQIRKLEIIKKSDILLNLVIHDENLKLHNNIIFNSVDYKLIGFDLRKLNDLRDVLLLAGIHIHHPTLILSEVVLAYLTPTLSNKVIQRMADMFEHCLFVTYEQICPNDGFGQFMCNHFSSLGSPLLSINEYPTRESQVRRYKELGWADANCCNMNEYYLYSVHDKNSIELVELFDEWEEWTLMCSHYIVLMATNSVVTQEISNDYFRFKLDNAGSCCHFNSKADCSNSCILTAASNMMTNDNHFKHVLGNYVSDKCMEDLNDIKNKFIDDCDPTGECIGYNDIDLPSKQCDNSDDLIHSKKLNLNTFLKEETPSRPCNFATYNANMEHNIHRFGHTSTLFNIQDVGFLTTNDFPLSSRYNKGILIFGGFGLDHKGRHRRLKFCDIQISKVIYMKNIERINHNGCTNLSQQLISNKYLANRPLRDDDQTLATNILGEEASFTRRQTKNLLVANEKESFVNLEFEFPLPLMHHTCTYIGGGKFVIFGGRTSPEKPSDAYCLQLNVNVDERRFILRDIGNSKNFRVPSPRWRHSSNLINYAGEQCLLIFGGCNLETRCLNDFWILNLKTFAYEKIISKGSQIPGRHSHTANLWGDSKVVICGGLAENITPLGDIYFLNIENMDVEKIEIVSEAFIPRFSHCSDIVGNNLIVVGGIGSFFDSPMTTVVNLGTATLTNVSINICPKISLPFYFCKHTMLPLFDFTDENYLEYLIIGGGGNCFSFGTLLNRSPYLLKIPISILTVD